MTGAPSLTDRIERALVFAAYVVVTYGPQYSPIVDRLERELEAARRDDPVTRAQRILDAYTKTAGLPAPADRGALPRPPKRARVA
jgi:hypothetical protein